MRETDKLSVMVDTKDWVLRMDDTGEGAREGATTTGDIVERDGEIIGGLAVEVLYISPRRLLLNENNNSLRAIKAVFLGVGIDAVLQLEHRAKNSKSIFTTSCSNPSDDFFPFAFNGVLFLVVDDGMVNCNQSTRPMTLDK